jgi:hypothetical protein
MARITIHASKAQTKSLGTTYVGFITQEDALGRWNESTQIHRLTRADALEDAARYRDHYTRTPVPKGA